MPFRNYKRKSYGKGRASTRAARSSSSRARAVAAARKTNVAVKRALRRPTALRSYATTKYKNRSAIQVLGKQVRMLQMKHYGDVQYTRQVLCTNGGTKDIKGNGAFMATAPFLFELKNFYHGARVFTGDINSNLEPTYAQQYRWLPLDANGATGTGKPYAFDVTDDTPSHHQYMPLSAFYQFHLKFKDLGAGYDKIFQITVFTLTNTQDNGKLRTALPDYLGAYGNMCVEDPSDRNRFSPVYQKVLYQRKYHIRNNGDVARDIEKYVNMKWSFSRKDGLVRIDTDQIEGSPTSTTQDFCAQHFRHIVPPQSQIYVLLSTSNQDTGIQTELSCMRTVRWRDTDGVTSM